MRLSKRRIHLRGRRLRVTLSCPKLRPKGCHGRATFTVKVGRRTIKLGSVKYAIRSGGHRTLTLRLKRSTVARLGHRWHRATVSLRESQPQGSVKVERLHFQLRR